MNSLDKSIDRLIEFHTKFKHPVNSSPYLNDNQLNKLREKLIDEEFGELKEGLKNKDPVAVTDALGDLLVVILGAGVSLGLPLGKAFDEIMDSNMSKLGEDGEPIYRADGKILKGPNYRPPDLKQFFT